MGRTPTNLNQKQFDQYVRPCCWRLNLIINPRSHGTKLSTLSSIGCTTKVNSINGRLLQMPIIAAAKKLVSRRLTPIFASGVVLASGKESGRPASLPLKPIWICFNSSWMAHMSLLIKVGDRLFAKVAKKPKQLVGNNRSFHYRQPCSGARQSSWDL